MPSKNILLLAAVLLISCSLFAQEKCPAKFGTISPEDFKQRYDLDTSAAAVIIADVGSSEFDTGNDWFVQVFKLYQRIHILKKSAYDVADKEIYLYMSGNEEERVLNLKASTYNLVDGKVVETKLEPKAVFTDKLDKNSIRKKFTLPNVKEGSIIEISYTINSEFPFKLRPWYFQSAYPVLWSEYEVELPEYYEYIFLSQGYNPFYIKDSKNVFKTYNLRVASESGYGGSNMNTQNVSLTPGVTRHRWVMKDLAPLKDESYVTTLRNHVSGIEFQLATIRYPNAAPKPVMSSWAKCMEELMKDEEYAGTLNKNNGFLSSTLEKLTEGVTDPVEKAQKIFRFVRDNYTCTDHSAIYASQSLKTTFNKKNGTVAEINLLLIAMLRQAGLDATPILLSTRGHGKVYEMYPLLTRFNYTIANLFINGTNYQLDATHPYLGFNRLPEECYNGHARMVNTDADALSFDADSLMQSEITGIFINSDENGNLKGHFQQQATYFGSCDLRATIKEKGKDEYFKNIAKNFHADIKVQNSKVDSLENYDLPVTIEYDFNLDMPDENGLVYLSPMFSEGMLTNPFKSAERKYPVEMPYIPDYIYTLSFMLPENYTVEDLPKSTIVKFNDGEGIFQFMVGQQGNVLQLRSRLKMGRATYAPDEYASLRDFFDVVVKKHAEQIVLKKKS